MSGGGFARRAALGLLFGLLPVGARAIDCNEPASVLERSACAVDNVRDQLMGIDLAYLQVAAALPAAEADALRMQHTAWAEEIAAMCDVESMAASSRQIDDSRSQCLGNHFKDWREWLKEYRRRTGRFDVFSRSIMQWNRDRHYEVRVYYPQLSNPVGSGERAFNDWAATEAKDYAGELDTLELARAQGVSDQDRKADLHSMLSREYRIESVGNDLIAVIWDDYAYGAGAAHGIPSTRGTLFSLAAARPLGAGDVFAANADWPQRATDLCLPQLAAQIPDTETGFTPGTVRDVIAEFTSWSFGPVGATITFDVYTIASYASGVNECMLPYEVLRPMLNPALSLGHG